MFLNAGIRVQNLLLGPVKTSREIWIHGPRWDLIWIFPGIWLFPIVLLLDDLNPIYATGVFLFWIGHRISSLYLGWFSKSYRPIVFNQHFRFIIIPGSVFFIVGLWVMLPETLLPLSLSTKLISLAILDYFSGIYHFASQHYGMLRLYRHLDPKSENCSERIVDRWYSIGLGGGLVMLAEVLHGTTILQEKCSDPLFSSPLIENQQ